MELDTAEMEMSYVETLSETGIKFGKKLWQFLRKSKKFPAPGVFWLFEPETDEWRLVIASPKVDTLGPRETYREPAEVTQSVRPEDAGQLLRIQVISPKTPIYQALRSVFSPAASVEGVRLGNTQVAAMYINDAYLDEIR